MKTILRKLVLIGFCFYMPAQAFAWGMLGHRIVGGIAEHYLTAKAKKEIQTILGNETVAMAGNWGDFIKSDPAFNYLYNWHFINLNDGFTYATLLAYLKKDTAINAYTQINFLIKELKNKKLEHAKKLMYLRLLIHIVGDVHQPMHTGREEDLGGNRIRVSWFNQPSNLHRVWDEHLIEYQQLSYTEYIAAINHASAKQVMAWQKQPLSQWIFDSYQISRQLYTYIKTPDEKLSYRYNFDHVDILNQQLLKGGIHLAGLLNELFGK